MFFNIVKKIPCLANSWPDVTVSATLYVYHTTQVDERLNLCDGFITTCDGCLYRGVDYQFCFLKFILSHVSVNVVVRRFVLSCIWMCFCERGARSSARSRSLSCVKNVHCVPFFLHDVTVLVLQQITKKNKNGDNKHPCGTPFLTSKLSDIWPAWATLHVMPLCNRAVKENEDGVSDDFIFRTK